MSATDEVSQQGCQRGAHLDGGAWRAGPRRGPARRAAAPRPLRAQGNQYPPPAPPSRCSRTTKGCRPSRWCVVCPLPTIPPAASPPLLPPRWRSHVTPPNHGRCCLAAARAVLRPPHPPLPTLPQRRRVRRLHGLPPRVALWRAGGPSPRVPRRPAAAAAAGCLPAPDGRTAPVGGHPPPASRGGGTLATVGGGAGPPP